MRVKALNTRSKRVARYNSPYHATQWWILAECASDSMKISSGAFLSWSHTQPSLSWIWCNTLPRMVSPSLPGPPSPRRHKLILVAVNDHIEYEKGRGWSFSYKTVHNESLKTFLRDLRGVSRMTILAKQLEEGTPLWKHSQPPDLELASPIQFLGLRRALHTYRSTTAFNISPPHISHCYLKM